MRLLLLIVLVLWRPVLGAEELSFEVHDQELTITRYPAQGSQLMIWLMPRVSATPRAGQLAQRVAAKGVEVWLLDLAESLFMPAGPGSLRQIEGRYVAGLIQQAHARTGKTISLMARGYAAIPALKGARHWQQQSKRAPDDIYLSGLVLISPDLYATIPALGQEPVYEPIASASNVPIMLYQSGKRGNRWQLDRVLAQLQTGGSRVYFKILPGVTGLFDEEDQTVSTREALQVLPAQLVQTLDVLQRTPTSLQVAELADTETEQGLGLDTRLTPFRATLEPAPLDLYTVQGERVVRRDYTGQVTVMNFWASWCPPCVEEIPSLNRLRKRMAGEAFELLSINYAEDRDRIRRFLDQVRVDFPVLLDPDGRYSAQWNVLVFPATFVIGPDGEIVYGVNGAIHWDDEEVIAELKALLPPR